jgi:hypothetical protein
MTKTMVVRRPAEGSSDQKENAPKQVETRDVNEAH